MMTNLKLNFADCGTFKEEVQPAPSDKDRKILELAFQIINLIALQSQKTPILLHQISFIT